MWLSEETLSFWFNMTYLYLICWLHVSIFPLTDICPLTSSQVNGVEATGKSQTDIVGMLRNVKLGSVVNLVISRQVTETEDADGEKKEDTTESVGICDILTHHASPLLVYRQM